MNRINKRSSAIDDLSSINSEDKKNFKNEEKRKYKIQVLKNGAQKTSSKLVEWKSYLEIFVFVFSTVYLPTEILSSDIVGIIVNITGCIPQYNASTCANNCLASKYRQINGACNNRNHPTWGASNTILSRWLPPQYEDGINEPKGWNPDFLYSSFSLPPVKEVTKKIIHASNRDFQDDDLYSHIIIEWGQYISHDMAFTPQSITKWPTIWGVDCRSTCENQKSCYPIKISTEEFFSQNRCIPFFRSTAACGTGDQNVILRIPSTDNPREQINSLTSFIDASTVYGSTPAVEKKVRNYSSEEGLLRINTQYSDHGRDYMPFVDDTPSLCLQDSHSSSEERIECFFAGESRSNEVISLAAIHTLWVREHNRLAKALKNLNPHWSSETTYQEARKIVGALHQIITVRDYITKIIGSSAFDQYVGKYQGYDENTDPSVSNVFSTAAFRFGHATIPPILHRLDSHYREHPLYPSILLSEVFFRPWRIIKEGGLDPLIRGLLGKPAKLQTQKQLMNEELTENLLVLSINGSMDLASLDLQRGRDHGLPGYNDWREYCALPRLNSTADLKIVISDANIIDKVIELYGHPNNIDVWLGGLIEDLLPNSRTGPLFACLIAKQMKALRDGDRFWYENPMVFTETQRKELEKNSLSRVVCDNTGLSHVPLDAFVTGKYPEDFVLCDSVPSLNLSVWKEDIKQKPHLFLKYRCFLHQLPLVLINHYCFYVSLDINECLDEANPPCHSSASCKNTPGSYECMCTDPYQLAEDKMTCIDSGRLPRASIVSIILGAILLASWAVMCWFLLYRGELLFKPSVKSSSGEDLTESSLQINCSKCHKISLSFPSIPLEQIHKDTNNSHHILLNV
ncbi:thyroid peroxidase [Pyxicephalus adspersus]|uniref:thyroid peroxidase n=1 Tax=Pyxicephalus adspersus TaxID=30357 RepID=UPI003B5AD355